MYGPFHPSAQAELGLIINGADELSSLFKFVQSFTHGYTAYELSY